jgi:hypothetical protein
MPTPRHSKDLACISSTDPPFSFRGQLGRRNSLACKSPCHCLREPRLRSITTAANDSDRLRASSVSFHFSLRYIPLTLTLFTPNSQPQGHAKPNPTVSLSGSKCVNPPPTSASSALPPMPYSRLRKSAHYPRLHSDAHKQDVPHRPL